ncbi:MAG: hypothetical protein H8D67_25655 [Deltaproteobacteria bacterium]|nr:hypothetical protein [Deltaproteobacteria bacterium]
MHTSFQYYAYHRGHGLARYAHGKTQYAGEDSMIDITRFLNRGLTLRVNPDKSHVCHTGECIILALGRFNYRIERLVCV